MLNYFLVTLKTSELSDHLLKKSTSGVQPYAMAVPSAPYDQNEEHVVNGSRFGPAFTQGYVWFYPTYFAFALDQQLRNYAHELYHFNGYKHPPGMVSETDPRAKTDPAYGYGAKMAIILSQTQAYKAFLVSKSYTDRP